VSGCRSRQLAPWPARTHGQHTDRVLGATQSRGFNVLMWRDGDLAARSCPTSSPRFSPRRPAPGRTRLTCARSPAARPNACTHAPASLAGGLTHPTRPKGTRLGVAQAFTPHPRRAVGRRQQPHASRYGL